MRRSKPPGVPDRAPILLRPSRHLREISAQTVPIRTISAVESFHKIQVRQTPAVKYDVVASSDSRYPVHGKTHGLIDHQEKIQQSKRNNPHVDHGRRQHGHELRMQNILWQPDFELSMLA